MHGRLAGGSRPPYDPRMSEGTAFVAGATGYTGREVVRALTERGVRTVAHVRPDSSRLAEHRARFEGLGAEVDTTPWEPEAMAATLRRLGPSVVFSLLGTTRARGKEAAAAGRPEESYETVDYGLSALLLAAARAVEPRPRFVYLSAVGVTPSVKNPYLAARARMERELRESGVPFTIARPSFITGPDREGRPGEKIGASVADAALSLAGAIGARRLRDRYRSMTGAELAEALVRAAFDPACERRALEADALRR